MCFAAENLAAFRCDVVIIYHGIIGTIICTPLIAYGIKLSQNNALCTIVGKNIFQLLSIDHLTCIYLVKQYVIYAILFKQWLGASIQTLSSSKTNTDKSQINNWCIIVLYYTEIIQLANCSISCEHCILKCLNKQC